MAHFEVQLELQAFSRVESLVYYRVSGTYQDASVWTVDYVEVAGQAGQPNWIRINRLHPYWAAYEAYYNSADFDRDVDAVVTADMETDFEELEPLSRYALASD